MSLTTPKLGLKKAQDPDNANTYLASDLADGLTVLDESVLLTNTQTLTNKSLTSPTITGAPAITVGVGGFIAMGNASDTAGLGVPLKAGAAPTADGQVAFDSTTHQLVYGSNGSTVKVSGLFFSSTLGAPAASFSITSIPATYKVIQIFIQGRSTVVAVNDGIYLQFNSDTAANYDDQDVRGTNVTASSNPNNATTMLRVGIIPGASATRANTAGACVVTIPNYAGTTFEKQAASHGTTIDSTAANMSTYAKGGSWRNTAAIATITVAVIGPGNFATGSSCYVYLR